MRRVLAAAAILIAAACAPAETTETSTGPDLAAIPTATAIPTTVPAAVPVAPTTPTPVTVPTLAPTAIPATVTPTPTLAPTATAGPTAVPAPARPTVAPTPNQSLEVQIANGAEVYTIACARCHGENGTGSDRYGGLLGVGNRYSTAGMIEELTNGHPITFGFAGQLSADEIASVVAYVKARFP